MLNFPKLLKFTKLLKLLARSKTDAISIQCSSYSDRGTQGICPLLFLANCCKFKIISPLIYVATLLNAHKAKSIQKFPEFRIRIFPRFSGSGFFPEFLFGETWGRSNSSPIFCLLFVHKLYMQFGLLLQAAPHEKCKKHTFFGLITILEKKNLFNKNCSQYVSSVSRHRGDNC